MTHTKILPDITVSSLTPRKKRFFLKYLARFLLLFENIRPVGNFLDNNRVVLVAAPHQSGKDEYLMILIILALDVDCLLSICQMDNVEEYLILFEKSKEH